MAWSDGLTGPHLEIAAYLKSPLRVVAGPGTGKTFALMRRVARLLESGIAPTDILAISFTRTAANDLVEKLTALKVPGADQVEAKTLHALCFQMLAKAGVFGVTGRTPRPLQAHEVAALECDLKDAFGGKREVRKLMKAFDAYWATLQSDQPGWPTDAGERNFHNALLSWLKFHKAILIGELVPLAYDFVRHNPTSGDIPRSKHIVVDEYQDLNRADQALIDLLAAGGDLTIVGDEDQSIYSFRHAHPAGINEFATAHAGTHDTVLDECRRCPKLVVKLAANLIANNKRAKATVLAPFATNSDGTVHVVSHATSRDEVDAIAAFVHAYLQSNPGLKAGQVLVLSTRRVFGYDIRDSLNVLAKGSSAAWSAQSFFYEEALDSESARRGFILLSLLANPHDRAALRSWFVLDDKNDGRANAYSKVRTHCEASGLEPRVCLDQLLAGTLSLPYTKPLLQPFGELIKELATAGTLNGQALVDLLFPAADVECQDIRQMAFSAAKTTSQPSDLHKELVTLISQPELPGEADDVVRIMSLFKSKGLTAKLAIVVGCVEGAIPRIDPDDAPAEQARVLEEQRRLFYVAMTRTTDTLVLSGFARMGFGAAMQMGLPVHRRQGSDALFQATRFIGELGSDCPATIDGSAWRKQLGL